MVEYNKTNFKWSDSQLSKLKTAAENQTGLTLRMNIKILKYLREIRYLINYY